MKHSSGRRPSLVAPRFSCGELFRFHSPKGLAPIRYIWITPVAFAVVWISWGFVWAIAAAPFAYGLQILVRKGLAADSRLRKLTDVQPRQPDGLQSFYDGYLNERESNYTGGLIINDIANVCEVHVETAAKFVDAFWGYVLPGEESLSRIGWRYAETGEWSVVIPGFGSFKAVRDEGLTLRSRKSREKQDGDESWPFDYAIEVTDFQRQTHRWARPVLEGKVSLDQLSTRRRIVWFISGAAGISLPRTETMLEYFLALLTVIFAERKATISWRRRGRMLPCREYVGKNPKTGESIRFPAGRYYIFESDPKLLDPIRLR